MKEKRSWLLLGASRGLGLSFAQLIVNKEPQSTGFCFSRKAGQMSLPFPGVNADFTKEEGWEKVFHQLDEVDYVVYFAGGGPYGPYDSKKWKDHWWSFQVSLLFPARLLNEVLKRNSIKKFLVIGSKIAESCPDPFASSYSSAKHGLKGLIESVKAESREKFDKIHIFSPGYMDTELLPPGAKPRLENPDKVLDPADVAMKIYKIYFDESVYTN